MERSGIVKSLIKVNPFMQVGVGVKRIGLVGTGVPVGMIGVAVGAVVGAVDGVGKGVEFPPQAVTMRQTQTSKPVRHPSNERDTDLAMLLFSVSI
jgi:hypothetical protein